MRERARRLGRRLPVTASWSSALPDGYAAIGISRGPPRGQRRGYRMYRPLAPGPWFKSVDAEQFRVRYLAQLASLDADQVLDDLAGIADGRIPALLCFEKPPPDPAWCHRSLVSAWLQDSAGIDMYDCVMTNRNARNGQLFVRAGRLNIANAQHREDPRPVEPGCGCECCASYSRAYLAHLYHAEELLYHRLASIHNLTHYLALAARAREAIAAGVFPDRPW